MASENGLTFTIDAENFEELTVEQSLLLAKAGQKGKDGKTKLSKVEQFLLLDGLQVLINEDISQVKLKDLGPVMEAIFEALEEMTNPETAEGN